MDPPPLDGLLAPFSFQAFDLYSPQMPPGRLSAHVWRGDDARDNLAWAVQQLAPVLGKSGITRPTANTLQVEWRNGYASVVLHAFPPDLQGFTLTNPAHQRDPRLVTACSIEVLTGWRLPLSAQEAQWLANSIPLAETGLAQPGGAFHYFAEPMLEYMRAGALPSGTINLAGEGEALLVQVEELFVLPQSVITGFSLSRLLPAKGPGGSSLNARCRGGDGGKDRSVLLARRSGVDDLNQLGEQLARLFGKPLELEPDQYDC